MTKEFKPSGRPIQTIKLDWSVVASGQDLDHDTVVATFVSELAAKTHAKWLNEKYAIDMPDYFWYVKNME